MRKAIVTFSKNWWTTFVDERDTPLAGAEAAAAAWTGLTPTPANATRMWQVMSGWGDGQLGNEPGLGTPDSRTRSPTPGGSFGGGPVPAPALRVKTKVKQEEGEPLSTFIQTFRKRVTLARVPPEDWLSQLEENLNKKSKKLFWESYNEGETWDQVILRMLGCVPDGSSLSLRQQIQKCRQFAEEDAVEFGHRLKALLEVFKSSTGT
jgi:hypothetical protein